MVCGERKAWADLGNRKAPRRFNAEEADGNLIALQGSRGNDPGLALPYFAHPGRSLSQWKVTFQFAIRALVWRGTVRNTLLEPCGL